MDIVAVTDKKCREIGLAYDVSREVARGAKALDELRPGWHKKVKKTTLNLGDGNLCVLGQLATDKIFAEAVGLNLENYDDYYAPGYDEAISAMRGDGPKARKIAADPVGFGFCTEYESYSDGVTGTVWDALTNAWIDEIKARRKADREAKV